MDDDDALANTVASGDPVALAATASSDDPAAAAPLPAQVGRYRIVRVLGAGGMGIVYLAIDPKLDRKVAIKVLRRGDTDDRLLREGQAIAKLHHANVVSVYDVGEHERELFIAMEYVPGGTLGAWLRGPRPWRDVLARFLAAGRGLSAAHAAGLVHRDFKPDNVLLGDGDRVVVTDFGLARAQAGVGEPTTDRSLDRTVGLIGTPFYMSPEQLRGEPADARADQFSFCVALWEALFGARPFDPAGSPPTTIEALRRAVLDGEIVEPPARDVPASITRALRRGLTRDPAGRFASLDPLLAALQPPVRRRWWIAGALVLAGGVAAAAAVLMPGADGSAASGVSCDAEVAEIDDVWNASARAAFVAADADPELQAQDLVWFDEVATRWRAARGAICRSATLDTAERARAIECTERARERLSEAIARADRATWPELEDPARCERAEAAQPAAMRDVKSGFGSGEISVAISPDGTQLAFIAGTDRGILDLDSGLALSAALSTGGEILSWTQDGAALLVRDGGRTVRFELASGSIEEIDGVGVPSPDQAYEVHREERAVRLVHASTGEEVVHPAAAVSQVAWEPGERRAAFVDSEERLVIIDLATRQISSNRFGSITRWVDPMVAWRRAGSLVTTVNVVADGSTRVVEVAVTESGTLATFPRTLLTAPKGEIIGVLGAASGHVVVERTRHQRRLFESVRGQTIERPMPQIEARLISADAASRHVLGEAGTQRFVVDRMGRVIGSAEVEPQGLYGFRDGRLLVGKSDGAEVKLFDVTAPGTSPALTVAGDLRGNLFCNAWKPHRCAIFSRGDAPAIVALDEGVPRSPVHVSASARSLDLAGDGHRVALVSGSNAGGSFGILDLATGETTHLSDPEATVQRVRWGPDDDAVYYTGYMSPRTGEPAFQLRRLALRPGAKPEIVVDTGRSWMSDPILFGPEDLIYTVTEFPATLAVIELE